MVDADPNSLIHPETAERAAVDGISAEPERKQSLPAAGTAKKAKKFGLVLQGGGALGAYEVGAIEYLYEMGMECAIVSGASSGAPRDDRDLHHGEKSGDQRCHFPSIEDLLSARIPSRSNTTSVSKATHL